MGSKIGDLYWQVDANTSKFDKGLKSTDKTAKGMGKTFSTLAKGIIAGLGVAAVAGVAKLSKELISAASEAEETRNKFDVVYRDISDAAEAAAENLADNFGLSGTAARSLLADTGDLLTGFGFTQESALDLSDQVNQLAVDLASFTNFSGGAKGASKALTKALLGERESVKALGISILDADVKAKVLEDTQAGLTFETERQAKAYATLQIAQEQSLNAQGDFTRSIDSYANQVRIAEANTQDLKEAWGEALLPLATKLTKAFSGITKALTVAAEENNSFNAIMEDLADGTADGKYSLDQLNAALEDLMAMNAQDNITGVSNAYVEQIKLVYGLVQAYGTEEDSWLKKEKSYAETAKTRKENEDLLAQIESDRLKALRESTKGEEKLEALRVEALSNDELKVEQLQKEINEWNELRGLVPGAEEVFIELARQRNELQAKINEGLKTTIDYTSTYIDEEEELADAMSISAAVARGRAEKAKQDLLDEIALVEELKQTYFSAAGIVGNIWQSINDIQSNVHDAELQRLQSEIDATEEGSTARADLEEKYANKKKALAIEDAKRQKALGIFNATISTAQAIIGYLANPGGPAGLILSALAGTAGALQIGAIASQPLPSFEQGGIVPQPPGVPATGDNVMIRANPGERIVPRDEAGQKLVIMLNLDGELLANTVINDYVNKGQILIDMTRGVR
jgi:hypothetical protein